MPSTEKLASGRYRGLYQDAQRKKKRVPGTFERKTDAYDAAVDAQAKAKRQAAAKTGALSGSTPWGQWWEIFNGDRAFESDTGRTEKYLVKNHVRPRWDEVPLNEIDQATVREWVNALKVGKKPSYVCRIYSVFRRSITAAVEQGIILGASPCAGVKLPKIQKRGKAYVTPADTKALGGELGEHYRDAVDFGLETGLRPGELTGLHAARVDLKSGWMTVAETYVYLSKKMRAWPKDKDERVVPLTSKAVEIVRRRIAGRDLSKPCGIPHMRDQKCCGALVFLGPKGRQLDRNVLNFQMREAADRASITRKSAYALRRGFITRAAEGGLDIFTLADMVGHEDVRQTKEYFQRTPSVRDRTLAALGEVLPLTAVPSVGREGAERGTDPSGKVSPEQATGATEEAG